MEISDNSKLTDLVIAPRAADINKRLFPAKQKHLMAFLDQPRVSWSLDCQPVTNKLLRKHLQTRTVGLATKQAVTLLKPALDSLEEVLLELKSRDPELWACLGCESSLAVRLSHRTGEPSVHAWGCAVNLTVNGRRSRTGTGLTFRALKEAYRFFYQEGWYWGAGFNPSEPGHFEASDQLLKKWSASGLISR